MARMTTLRIAACSAILLALFAGTSGRAATPASSDSTAAAAQPSSTVTPLDDPDFLRRARAYTTGNYWLFLADTLLSLTFLAWLAFSGAAARAWGAIAGRFGPGAPGTLVFLAAFILCLSLVSLPLDFYDGYVREHAYGFSTQTPGSWGADRIIDLLVGIPLAALVVVPILATMRRFPKSWWIIGTMIACAFAVIAVAVEPVFIAPLYNDFKPIQDEELKTTILGLAHENGVPANDVYQMNASSRSIHDNAYATGLLGTERIVLYDTLLSSYTRDEIAFVMGHEIGHRVLNHIWKGLALACALIFAGLFIVDRAMRKVLALEGAGRLRTGLKGMGDAASIPLIMLITTSLAFVTLPIQSAYSRALESEADQFGMRAVAHPEAGPGAFRKMAARNLADPDPPPLIEWFLYSHPSMGKRIRAAEEFVERRTPNGP